MKAASLKVSTSCTWVAKAWWSFTELPPAPLLAPVVRVDGLEIEGTHVHWERLEQWLPRMTAEALGVRVTGTICAPIGHRGFVYSLHVENVSDRMLTVQFGWRGAWARRARRFIAVGPCLGSGPLGTTVGPIRSHLNSEPVRRWQASL